jgi:hypothetical protein
MGKMIIKHNKPWNFRVPPLEKTILGNPEFDDGILGLHSCHVGCTLYCIYRYIYIYIIIYIYRRTCLFGRLVGKPPGEVGK